MLVSTSSGLPARVARTFDAILAAGVCLLLAFGPLAFGGTGASAVFILECGSAALLVLWALRGIVSGEINLAVSPLILPMLLFAGVVGVQLLFDRSAYWYASWLKALLWAAYGMLAFVAAQCFRTTRSLKLLGICITVFGCSMAMFALLQKFAGNGKLYWFMPNQAAAEFFGPYPNHAHYAGLMELLAPFPLVLAMCRSTSIARRVLYYFAAILMGSSVFLSKSRGGVIAFVVELGVLTFVASWGRRRKSQVRLWSGFFLLLLFCIVLVRPHGLWDRFMQVGVPVDKLYEDNRLSIFEDSLRMVRQRPVMGWGFGSFAVVYPSFRSFYTDLTVNAAHNDVLELTVETGLVGFCVIVAFVFRLYGSGTRSSRNWRRDPRATMSLAALIGCTGLLVHSFSDFNLQVPGNAALFFVLATIAAGTGKQGLHNTQPEKSATGVVVSA